MYELHFQGYKTFTSRVINENQKVLNFLKMAFFSNDKPENVVKYRGFNTLNPIYLPTLNSISTMKKVYLLAPALLAATAFGQVQKNAPLRNADNQLSTSNIKSPLAPYSFAGKAGGDIIFSEDFNGSMGTFTINGTNENDTLWKFDTDGPNGQFSNPTTQKIQSTTNANGFMIFDADKANAAQPFMMWNGNLTSPVVNMSAVPAAILSFEHTYRFCCSGAWYPQVQVSTDGFATFASYNVTIPGFSTNNTTPTYTHKLNITGFMDTASNLSNMQFRFRWEGDLGASHYYWQIDDIKIYEAYTNDMNMRSGSFYAGAEGIPYYNVPTSQITPITFQSVVRNDGAATENNSLLTVTFNGANPVVSPTKVIAAGAQDTLISATYTPAATPGVVNIAYAVSGSAADQFPSDNMVMDSLRITDTIYSVDNGIVRGSITNFSSNSGQPFKIGNVMEVMNNMTISRMAIRLTTSANNVGQLFSGEIQLYDAATGEFSYLTETDEVTVTSTNNGTVIMLPLLAPETVSAGDVLLVLARHNGSGGNTDLGFASCQSVPSGIVFGYDASSTLFGLSGPSAVYVRLVEQDPTTGITENKENITVGSLFPNPTNNTVALNYSLKSGSDVAVSVTDLSGKVVYTSTSTEVAGGHTLTIDASEFNNGMYLVNVTSNDATVTKRFVKK